MRRYILTGTPGSGKTSVVCRLQALGYNVIHEAATCVAAERLVMGEGEYWRSVDFIDEIVFLQKRRQYDVKGDLQFYDRSPFCTYALARHLGFDISATLMEEVGRCMREEVYQKQVLFFENLGFVEHTEVRKISYEEALRFEKVHLGVYKEFGFNITLIPKASVQERCELILSCVK